MWINHLYALVHGRQFVYMRLRMRESKREGLRTAFIACFQRKPTAHIMLWFDRWRWHEAVRCQDAARVSRPWHLVFIALATVREPAAVLRLLDALNPRPFHLELIVRPLVVINWLNYNAVPPEFGSCTAGAFDGRSNGGPDEISTWRSWTLRLVERRSVALRNETSGRNEVQTLPSAEFIGGEGNAALRRRLLRQLTRLGMNNSPHLLAARCSIKLAGACSLRPAEREQ